MISLSDYHYEGVRRVQYGDEGATFIPVCEKCGRFVKAPATMQFVYEGPPRGPHTECSKCGPTQMIFEGYIG